MINKPIKTLDELIECICHDTYFLTRDDIDAIEAQLSKAKQMIEDAYQKCGKNKIWPK